MHAYKEGAEGRSFHSDPIDGLRYARISCTECEFTGKIKIKTLMPPDQLDRKFAQKGWELTSRTCPTCVSKHRFERTLKAMPVLPEGLSPLPGVGDTTCSNFALISTLANEPEPEIVPAVRRAPQPKKPKLTPIYTKTEPAKEPAEPVPPPAAPRNVPIPTQSKPEPIMTTDAPLADNDVLRAVAAETHKSAARMHQLLAEHFSTDECKYAPGWSDERVAAETGQTEAYVAEVREVAYGPLKEPDAFNEARTDLKLLHELFIEMMAAADKKHDEEMEKIKTDMQREVSLIMTRMTEAAKALGFKF